MDNSPSAEDVDLVCPISLCIFDDPVEAADGFVYDRKNIERYIAQGGNEVLSPMTREVLQHHNLKARGDMLQRVEEWKVLQQSDPNRPQLQTLSSAVFESLDRFSLPREVSDSLPKLRLPSMVVLGNEASERALYWSALWGFRSSRETRGFARGWR
eukprot:Hpha_TRINITY_DN21631_c0_g1::TRINITY_DN21631_c0_g1_i1::g.63906::m.63906